MSFLPDIEDGQIKEVPATPKPYTPPTLGRPTWDPQTTLHNDRNGSKWDDAPRMQDMHECVPNDALECIKCGREMLI